jgi:post-GPI attachment to proteins factor 2
MKNRKMLPKYQILKDELDQRKPLLSVSFQKFSVTTVSLPLFSFIFCVSYSLIYHFEASTSTHCHTWNYLPSISVSTNYRLFLLRPHFLLVLMSWQAAIGQFQPQAIVWQICIIIHFIPRLIITWMYKK